MAQKQSTPTKCSNCGGGLEVQTAAYGSITCNYCGELHIYDIEAAANAAKKQDLDKALASKSQDTAASRKKLAEYNMLIAAQLRKKAKKQNKIGIILAIVGCIIYPCFVIFAGIAIYQFISAKNNRQRAQALELQTSLMSTK